MSDKSQTERCRRYREGEKPCSAILVIQRVTQEEERVEESSDKEGDDAHCRLWMRRCSYHLEGKSVQKSLFKKISGRFIRKQGKSHASRFSCGLKERGLKEWA
ncbi:hypothetical protein MCU_01426 [Bartonella elizabethae Re6043vi]|uniref:Uncharacterized protein n=2 Tax=Bartonella elizabethae TaxID=807 RepID=J1K770_BAREL|nr:hypothetical protein [Bartonella elizabethae]EJF82503.1 hypothetical protein MCU_01426 [Bartonella elizabethae Re6043vi]EJF93487.1 hypothetical protein MEE_01465 [Bartonella elizabethae F9251 = ATCC 49927]VEJ41872.1 Uncharacterised protein [Bartonella elizabethae]